jgi:hypothetical protein
MPFRGTLSRSALTVPEPPTRFDDAFSINRPWPSPAASEVPDSRRQGPGDRGVSPTTLQGDRAAADDANGASMVDGGARTQYLACGWRGSRLVCGEQRREMDAFRGGE